MPISFKNLLLTLVLMSSFNALAKIEDRSINKGAEITVDQYDKKAKVFLIIINKESAVGPNYATPEALAKAIGSEKSDSRFKEGISQLIGAEFTLKSDLPLLSEEKALERMKSFKKKEKQNTKTIPGSN